MTSAGMISAAALPLEAETGPGHARRILVAEDSPTTHEILKLLLQQRGHDVDIATDGEQALEALRHNHYDVALLDFHLPKMSGLDVAATIRHEAHGRQLPRLVAITADVEGLLADEQGCDNFDQVLPKPLDIYHVAQVVEGQEEIAEAERLVPAHRPPAPRVAEERHSPLEDLGYNWLTWPGDIDVGRLSARAMQASLGDPRFDGILVKVPVPIEDFTALWNAKGLYALPLIDLTGTLGRIADVDASRLTALDKTQLDDAIRSFHERRSHLHRDLQFSTELGEQIIGKLYISNRPLTPSYNPLVTWLVSYDVSLATPTVAREAEALCERGLLRREFFDTFHVCTSCESHRLHVREECSQCHSSHLVEEQYLHHFRCAYQGPEREFRRGDQLICPKCRYELTHFGFDYDRPGSMVVCQACGHAASEPDVGFICLDCHTHIDADIAPTHDLYTYQLTDNGIGFAEHGHSILGFASHALRFADLPLELVVALNTAAKEYNERKVPFTLIDILYRNEREVISQHGARAFAKARDLFVENLRAALGDAGLVVRGHPHDYVLLSGIGPDQARSDFDLLLVQAENTLRHDVGASFHAFGPEDFA